MLITGTAYYPEEWDSARIAQDARMIKESGMTLVRIGEFAWSHMERSNGVFTFEWLHEAFSIFRENGLGVILCTPTAAAPPWLIHEHPETLKQDFGGRRAYIGVREHTCYAARAFLRYSERIVEKMAQEFHGEENLFAWQIDNEIGQSIFPYCYCDDCQKGFREFLKRKYGTVEALNQAWGNTFWSLEYSDWEQIRIGGPDLRLNASQVLDSQLYRSRTMYDFTVMQRDIIRKYAPHAIVTTNNYSGLGDQHEVYSALDVAAGDFYVDQNQSLASMTAKSDFWRGLKQDTPAWLLEIAPAPWRPSKNLIGFLMWEFFARGMDVQIYFHWRTHPAGKEKTNPVFISFGNKETDSLRIFTKTFRELRAATDRFGTLPQPKCEAAVLSDFTSNWIFVQGDWARCSWMNNGHRALTELGINADIVSPLDDLSRYKLLVIPVHTHFSEDFAAKLRDFIAAGGILLAGSQSGIYDEYAKYLQEPGPEGLRDVFGIEVDYGVTSLLDRDPAGQSDTLSRTVRVSGSVDGEPIHGIAEKWIASVEAVSADVLMRFDNGMFEGMPFLTEHPYGKGRAIYLGTALLDHDTYRKIVRYAVHLASIRELVLPQGVEVIARGPVTFVLNYSVNSVSFDLPLNGRSLVDGSEIRGHLELPPFGYCAVETQ